MSKENRRIIRRLSNLVIDPVELNLDEERLARSAREAGEDAIGISAVEVWVLADDKLIRPKGGWWRSVELQTSDALGRLEEEDEVDPVNPGVCVAGILWAESYSVRQNSNRFMSKREGTSRSSVRTSTRSSRVAETLRATERLRATETLRAAETLRVAETMRSAIVWRDLMSIVHDPDSAKTARIDDMVDAGLDKAVGIPFYLNGRKAGIVVYYSRSTADTNMISSIANEAYMTRAANMIGSTYSMLEARRAVTASRKQDVESTQKTGSLDIIAASNKTLEKEYKSERKDTDEEYSRLATYCRKYRGGNLQVPPPMGIEETMLTIFGCFCTLLVLSSLNENLQIVSDGEFRFLIPPFGALMTLMYGLSSAPASQPRNAILGQAVAGAIALAFAYIPDEIIPRWVQRAIGPAFAIGAMAKLGITHPPAGAMAVLYSSGSFNFVIYGFGLLANVVAVIFAILINNLSPKRQYPTYWSILKVPDWMRTVVDKKKDQKTHLEE